MNITADATLPGSLGSFGYDDEGVPAQRVDIVRDGTWVGVLSGRDSAPLVRLQSGGMVRADGPARLPMVRMTTASLLPGDSSLHDRKSTRLHSSHQCASRLPSPACPPPHPHT